MPRAGGNGFGGGTRISFPGQTRKRKEGCGCSTIFIIFFIILIFIFAAIASNDSESTDITYSATAFESYADMRYEEIYNSSSKTYEDNILLVFTVNEECDGYYTIAWVGDNINEEIVDLFGDEDTEYGYMTSASINKYYENTLDDDLVFLTNRMRDRVLNLDTYSFIDSEKGGVHETSRVYNFTYLYLDEEIINDALEEFTEKTDIPISIVIDYEEVVFGDEDYETVRNLLSDEYYYASGNEDDEYDEDAIISGDVDELPDDNSEDETEILSETSEASEETSTENKDI